MFGFEHFYPRSPCGERRARRASRQQPAGISIHALLAESDRRCFNALQNRFAFLSTLSLRRATNGHETTPYRVVISIHALLAESDAGKRAQSPTQQDFYPRSPCGERPSKGADIGHKMINFYPRSPCGERRFRSWLIPRNRNFYPRSPCGERLINTYHRIFGEGISIHALLAESDTVS